MLRRQPTPGTLDDKEVGLEAISNCSISNRKIKVAASSAASAAVLKRTKSSDGKKGVKKTRATSRRRKVRFSASMSQVVATIDHRDDLTDKEKEAIYMSPDNVQQIRDDAKFVTKYFRSRTKEYIEEIDQAYCSSLTLATNHFSQEEFTELLRDGNPKLEEAAAPLNNWCSKAKVSGRGLERYCSQKQRAERGAFAADCRQAVLRLACNPGVGCEDVATFYNEYARSCTLFARMMGQQDEEAAKEACRQMALKEKAKKKKQKHHQDIVVVLNNNDTTTATNTSPTTLQAEQPQDIVLPPLADGIDNSSSHQHNKDNCDRRNLLLKSKQMPQSSSAQRLMEHLNERVGSNRVLGDHVAL